MLGQTSTRKKYTDLSFPGSYQNEVFGESVNSLEMSATMVVFRILENQRTV